MCCSQFQFRFRFDVIGFYVSVQIHVSVCLGSCGDWVSYCNWFLCIFPPTYFYSGSIRITITTDHDVYYVVQWSLIALYYYYLYYFPKCTRFNTLYSLIRPFCTCYESSIWPNMHILTILWVQLYRFYMIVKQCTDHKI